MKMLNRFAPLLLAASLLFSVIVGGVSAETNPIEISWKGHACFTLQSGNFSFVFDPFGPHVGYPIHDLQANAVFISHEHFDHNNTDMVPGAEVLRGLKNDAKSWNLFTKELAPGVTLKTVGVYHDKEMGKKRGLDAVAVLDLHGVRFVHLGDLGHLLTPEQVKAIGPVDVLFIPVGGFFTIDGDEAKQVVAELHPRVVIPMHYKTRFTNPQLPIETEKRFISGLQWPLKQLKTSSLILSKDRLPKSTTVYVLEPLTSFPAYRL